MVADFAKVRSAPVAVGRYPLGEPGFSIAVETTFAIARRVERGVRNGSILQAWAHALIQAEPPFNASWTAIWLT